MTDESDERVRLYSTFPRFDRVAFPTGVTHVDVTESSALDLAQAYFSSEPTLRCFLFNGLTRGVWVIALLKLLFPRRSSKLVVVDMVLSVPSTRRERRVVPLRRALFGAVDAFVTYARNTDGIQELYGIPKSRLIYVPFKVNDLELVDSMKPSDEGYLVVAGQTRRDFQTFRSAIEDLPMPVRIVAPGEQVLARHDSTLEDEGWPDRVTFVRDAITAETFLPELARARLVVLPIVPENITPSGISVCLVAMALRKCVVVSAGPVADGMIDGGQAIVVPPGDAGALRDAIARVWEDDESRESIAQRGFHYARSLGGEDRLYRDLVDVALRSFTESAR